MSVPTSSTSFSSQPPVHIDGTTLEGGGQLVRLALSLSSLTHIPIHITNIRGKRGPKSSSKQGGGLKAGHLAGTQWLARATGAEAEGMEIKSKELVFRPPRKVKGREKIEEDESSSEMATGKEVCTDKIRKEVRSKEKFSRRQTNIPMSTPGSVFLIFQAILPYIIFSAAESSASNNDEDMNAPVRITIEGGTNVSKSPSYEYINEVLLPMLNLKTSIPPITMKLNRRGWTQGRVEVGSVTFDIQPLRRGSFLPAFSFTNRGELTKVRVSIIAPGAAIRDSIKDRVIEQVLRRHPDVEILISLNEDSAHSKRLYLLLVAETSSGYRLGRDWLFDRNTGSPKAVDQLVSQVIVDLEQEIAHGGCVDEYLQDQLVVFQALAQGRAFVDAGKGREESLHTKTVRWAAEEMLGVEFDGEGVCGGISFKAGEEFWLRDPSKITLGRI